MENKIRLEFTSIAENVALSRLVVASLASQMNFGLSDIEELKVAVSEAVSNSIIHGYGGKPSGIIIMEAYQEADNLVIKITDTGRGIADIEQALQPTFSTQPDRMGLGFVFMQSFMDDFRVESQLGKWTRVTMVKKTGRTMAELKTSHN